MNIRIVSTCWCTGAGFSSRMSSLSLQTMKLKTNLILSLLLATIVSFVLIRKSRTDEKHELPVLTSAEHVVFDQGSLKGKVVIASYFQTWCSDCVKEQPDLQKLQDHFGKDKLTVLMISDEPHEKIAAFKTMFGSQLGFYKSASGLKQDLGIKAFPTTFLLDRKGKVKLKKVEGIHWYTPEIIAKIDELLKK